MYIADSWNHVIRKISPDLQVITFAGVPNKSGTYNADRTEALFTNPYGICLDGKGNIFVTEQDNHTIRIIFEEGHVETVAGRPGRYNIKHNETIGEAGDHNSTSVASTFRGPSGITVDHSGNIYVCDSWNHVIRRITPGSLSSVRNNGKRVRWKQLQGLSAKPPMKGTRTSTYLLLQELLLMEHFCT